MLGAWGAPRGLLLAIPYGSVQAAKGLDLKGSQDKQRTLQVCEAPPYLNVPWRARRAPVSTIPSWPYTDAVRAVRSPPTQPNAREMVKTVHFGAPWGCGG